MAGLLTGPATEGLQKLFIPAVCLLILFLGYTSQWLFNTAEYLEPGPMTQNETTIFNILLACVWLTYYKACTVPPGRYNFPPPKTNDDHHTDESSLPAPHEKQPARWCNKCAAPKPLRAHHCRHCGTCIPKMDHHCPWTGTCVSLQTFPYFLRFLVYTNLALAYLHARLLWPRLRALFWDNSALPAYLGPSVPAIAHLALLALLAALTSVALLVLLLTSARSWVLNQTMIEGWEQDRHDAVLLRQQRGGGWWSPDDEDEDDDDHRSHHHHNRGSRRAAPIARVEFPYDIGFFTNMAQAMGTRNILSWLDPLVGGGPKVSSDIGRGTGWVWEENGFNDREGMWPPPDPDKTRRGVKNNAKRWDAQRRRAERDDAEMHSIDAKWEDPQQAMAAFRARQEMDLRRRTGASGVIGELDEGEGLGDLAYEGVGDGYSSSNGGGGGGYYDEEEEEDSEEEEEEAEEEQGDTSPAPPGQGRLKYEQGIDGEPGWTNAEGDRLRDYGVDEDAEDDDEDVPLGELLRRRRAYASKSDG